jgi:hypothetical protein
MPGSRLTILLACLLIRRDSLNAGQSIPACQNCSPFCSESTFGIGASPCRHGLLMKEEPRRRCCKRRRLAKVGEGLAAIGELDRHEPTAARLRLVHSGLTRCAEESARKRDAHFTTSRLLLAGGAMRLAKCSAAVSRVRNCIGTIEDAGRMFEIQCHDSGC